MEVKNLEKTGYVYKICSHQTDKIYIGATIQALCERMADHRRKYKHYMAGQYEHREVFEIMKYENPYIELLEIVKFTDKYELDARKGKFIRECACVNKKIAGRTKKGYYQDNKKELEKKKAEWIQKNKTAIREQKKQYRERNYDKLHERHNCECGGSYTHPQISKHLKTNKHRLYVLLQAKTQA